MQARYSLPSPGRQGTLAAAMQHQQIVRFLPVVLIDCHPPKNSMHIQLFFRTVYLLENLKTQIPVPSKSARLIADLTLYWRGQYNNRRKCFDHCSKVLLIKVSTELCFRSRCITYSCFPLQRWWSCSMMACSSEILSALCVNQQLG